MTSKETRLLDEALAYVYVAQYVRPDGPSRAGVVDQDCRRYFGQLEELVASGDVEMVAWTHLDGLGPLPRVRRMRFTFWPGALRSLMVV